MVLKTYGRFFYGEFVKVEKDGKLNREFQFKLKDELVEALGRIDRELDNEINEIRAGDIMEDKKTYDSFYDYLIKNEYLFDKKTIENYLLSLKVKPFAILTGNSGTGKTKLSQLFARYIASKDNEVYNEIVEEQIEDEFEGFEDDSPEVEDFVPVKVTTAKSSWNIVIGGKEQNPGWTISNKCFSNYLPIDQIIGDYEIEVDGIKGFAHIHSIIQVYYTKSNNKFKKEFQKLYEQEEENRKIAK